ncbi:MAG TPA: choice-of-anchor tandem repeat NxxGxxAF-containing protein [Phycisphaerae bacterium]|nr:choice-of-anchor tandem repeat NxxGxxAF-containing protein [Phycisphaerae bacterium]
MSSPRISASGWAAIAACVLFCHPAYSQTNLQPVALPGDSPGGGWGAFQSFRFAPAINASGEVAFQAANQQLPNGGNSSGVEWVCSNSGFQYVAAVGLDAPVDPPGRYSDVMSSMVLSDSGRVAFTGAYDNSPGFSKLGLFGGTPSGVGSVVNEDTPVPGFPGTNFGWPGLNNFITAPPAITSGGQIAFGAEIGEGTLQFSIWTQQSGDPVLIAYDYGPAPGTSKGDYFLSVSTYQSDQESAPRINDAGNVAFRAHLAGPGVDASNQAGLWAQNAGSLQLVSRAGQQAAGTSPGTIFLDYSEPGLNNHGAIAFRGVLTGPDVTPQNNVGIWRNQGNTMSLVARSADAAAGVPSAVFSDFGTPLINGQDKIAFSGRLAGASVTTDNDSGLWVDNAGALQLIARESDPALGLGKGIFFGDGLGIFAMNALGQIVIDAPLSGSAVTTANDRGLWVDDPLIGLKLVLSKGEQVEIHPGDFRTISDYVLPFAASGGQDGRKEVLNDSGQLVVDLTFTDGTTGIFVTDVPEPSVGIYILLLIVCGVRSPRRMPRSTPEYYSCPWNEATGPMSRLRVSRIAATQSVPPSVIPLPTRLTE